MKTKYTVTIRFKDESTHTQDLTLSWSDVQGFLSNTHVLLFEDDGSPMLLFPTDQVIAVLFEEIP